METKVNDLVNDLIGNDGVSYMDNVQEATPVQTEKNPEPVETVPSGNEELITDKDHSDINKFLEDLGFKGTVEEAKKKLLSNDEEDTDEFIEEYKSYKSSGKGIDEFLEEKYKVKKMNQLDSDEGLFEYFRSFKDENNNQKYSDDDIESFLNSKTKIEKDIMWENIRKKLKEPQITKNVDESQKQQQLNEKSRKEYLAKVNDYNTNFVNKILSYAKSEITKSNNEIYGLNVGESELKEFDKEFEDLVRIDADGEPMIVYPKKVLQYINNPVELYKMLFIKRGLDSGKYILLPKSKISEMQEQILEKMGVAPKSKSVQPKTPVRPPKPEEFV